MLTFVTGPHRNRTVVDVHRVDPRYLRWYALHAGPDATPTALEVEAWLAAEEC